MKNFKSFRKSTTHLHTTHILLSAILALRHAPAAQGSCGPTTLIIYARFDASTLVEVYTELEQQDTYAPLTKEQYEYAKTHIACLIAKHVRQGRDGRRLFMTAQDAEDIRSFAMWKLIKQWPSFDPAKAKWTTFIPLVLETAVLNGFKWLWRQKWRIPEHPLQPTDAERPAPQDDDLYQVIDDIIPDATGRKICKMRLAGLSLWQIIQRTGSSKRHVTATLAKLHEALTNRLNNHGDQDGI